MASQLSTLVDLTDAQLAGRLLDDDSGAMAEVYRRHATQVLSVADAVLSDRGAAEDVCHDVFVELSLHPQRCDLGRGTLRTYLVVLAHSRALDRLRSDRARSRREKDQVRFLAPAGEDAEHVALRSTMAMQVWAAVNTLPAPEADALRLAYFGGATYREVAHILHVAEGTVKSRIRRGLRRLRRAFVEQGFVTSS